MQQLHAPESREDREVFEGFFQIFRPTPILTVSEWADRERYLASVSSSEPGRWRTDRTPYLRELMDCLSASSPVEEVVFIKGAQIGGTEAGLCWIGYVISTNPGPMLMVQPTVDIAKRASNQRLTPLVNESPAVRERVRDNRSRDSGNTMLSKEFPGGVLLLAGANSAAGLRSMPIRDLFLDEVDAYPLDVEGEGDPVELAKARTRTFSRRKVLLVSTPTIKGVSRIEHAYLETDQRRYFVPCPHCGEKDYLRWSRLVIPKKENGSADPDAAFMLCETCGGVIEEKHKTDMLLGGEWVATAPDNTSRKRRGYHINALYSPLGWFSWAEVAKKWGDAQGNPLKLKEFVNTVLGETWEERGETIDETGLMSRAEDYEADPLPAGVLVVTAGVDVQHDRIELEFIGWGVGEESWSLDYVVVRGDPTSPQVWQLLDLQLMRDFRHPSGVRLRAARVLVDSGDGTRTQEIYNYTGPRGHMGVFAMKGMPGEDKPIAGVPTHNNIGKVPLFPVGTHAAKDLVYGRLRIPEPAPGYCHFPKRYGPHYYEMLTAEEVRIKYSKGFAHREWHKKRHRNEALDCRVYGTAALYSLGVNLEQLAAMMSGKMPEGKPRRVTALE